MIGKTGNSDTLTGEYRHFGRDMWIARQGNMDGQTNESRQTNRRDHEAKLRNENNRQHTKGNGKNNPQHDKTAATILFFTFLSIKIDKKLLRLIIKC